MKKIILVFMMIFISYGYASDECKAIALRSVSSIQNPSSIMYKGEYMTSISQYREENGVSVFCAHGGYCFPRYISAKGKKVEALRLINCKIGQKRSDGYGGYSYELILERTKISPKESLFNDIEDILLDMGLCSSCADNAARYYIEKPSSACATLVRAALSGNYRAKKALIQFPSYCNYRY